MVTPSVLETSQSTDETRRLLDEAKSASVYEQERLHGEAVLLNLPLAEALARRYAGRGEPLEDLTQVACVALTEAVHRFDPDRGHDFAAFAVPTITGAIKRHFRDHAWAIRPPRRVQEMRPRVWLVAEELTQHLGRAPRPSEIAAALHAEVADVIEAISVDDAYSPDSLDLQFTDEDGGTGPMPGPAELDDNFERAEVLLDLGPACMHLTRREQRIIYLRFYRELKQREIAEELGVSQMQVSRLLTAILAKLRARLSPSPSEN